MNFDGGRGLFDCPIRMDNIVEQIYLRFALIILYISNNT
jgi:hypothetical protein